MKASNTALTLRNYRTFLLNQTVKVGSKGSADTIKALTTKQLKLAYGQGIVDYRIALVYIFTNNNNKNSQKLSVMATTKKAATAAKKHSGRATAKEYAKKHCKGLGAVAAIVMLGKKGYDQKAIIEAGYNKNTVYRQYREKVQA